MSSDEPEKSTTPVPGQFVVPAVGKGCLAGLALLVLFVGISGLTYLILKPFGLSENTHLFFTVLSGPLLGTIIGLIVGWRFLRRNQP